MQTILLITGFGGAVAACTRFLMRHTERDADRWLNRGTPQPAAAAESSEDSPGSRPGRRESVA